MSILMILSILPISGMTIKNVSAATLANPRIVSDSSMESGQKVTWDCVWFGSYPQTEIVDKPETSGCYGRPWETDKDYDVNASLYNSLKSASYDSNGDTIVSGKKYRRLKESDETYTGGFADEDGTDLLCHYDWSHGDTYHYFRYDPIKWRVLKTDGSKALLLADKALDVQKYNEEDKEVTWETCTMRSWLNGIFLNNAFSSSEKSGIVTTNVVNHDNIEYGAIGGNNTSDKVFLLSEEEVYYTNTAKSYGFVKYKFTEDEGRRSKCSSYAKAMGTYVDDYSSYLGNCFWWLRSPDGFPNEEPDLSSAAVNVETSGEVGGFWVYGDDYGVRPALNLNLSSSSWSNAGTVCSDETIKETAPHNHTYDAGKTTKLATCTAKGVKTYTCSCGYSYTNPIAALGHNYKDTWTTDKKATLTASGSKSHHCSRCSAKKDVTAIAYPKTIKLSATSYTYNGSVKKPTVSVTDSAGNTVASTNYTVTYSADTPKNAGTYTVTVTFKGNYSGTKKLTYTINKAAATIKLAAKTTVYTGSAIKIGAATKTGSTGAVTYSYYSDSAYTKKLSAVPKNVGTYYVKATVAANTNYKAATSAAVKMVINPKATVLGTVTPATKAFTVKWTKVTVQTTGYQIQYSTSSTFASGNKTVTVTSNATASKKISSLTAKKTYYVRIRTYKTVGSTKYYSAWSAKKSVKTK